MLYNVYIAQVIMAKAVHAPVKNVPARIPARARVLAGKPAQVAPVKDPRAPLQILRSTKEWLDQIIAERDLRTYDEAIMFLITERQRNLPSDFGVFSDMEEYVCNGED
jgi:hypothetical protein